jgi:hypothetical protein
MLFDASIQNLQDRELRNIAMLASQKKQYAMREKKDVFVISYS